MDIYPLFHDILMIRDIMYQLSTLHISNDDSTTLKHEDRNGMPLQDNKDLIFVEADGKTF